MVKVMEQGVESAGEKQNGGGKKLLWLSLLNAETEEDLDRLRSFGVPEINKAIDSYYEIISSTEFREIERMRKMARHEEAIALRNARDEGRAEGKLEIARKMKNADRPLSEITDFTGLSTETIIKM